MIHTAFNINICDKLISLLPKVFLSEIVNIQLLLLEGHHNGLIAKEVPHTQIKITFEAHVNDNELILTICN